MSSFSSDSLLRFIMTVIARAPGILFAISFHEAAHAWTAERLGDPTARYLGRVTLNPLRHLDPIGVIAMFLFGFGWARPVPVNPYFLRRQGRDFALTAIAGPAANIIAGLGFGLIVRLIGLAHVSGFFWDVATGCVYINLALAIFNLIPIPPLDGSRVVYYLLPGKMAAEYIKLEAYGIYVMIGVILLDRYTGIISGWMMPLVGLLSGLFGGPALGGVF